jgi:hypothetical protein
MPALAPGPGTSDNEHAARAARPQHLLVADADAQMVLTTIERSGNTTKTYADQRMVG